MKTSWRGASVAFIKKGFYGKHYRDYCAVPLVTAGWLNPIFFQNQALLSRFTERPGPLPGFSHLSSPVMLHFPHVADEPIHPSVERTILIQKSLMITQSAHRICKANRTTTGHHVGIDLPHCLLGAGAEDKM